MRPIRKLFFLLGNFPAAICAQNSIEPPDTLIKVCADTQFLPDGWGGESIFPTCGYMDRNGEIVVPIGKYAGCMNEQLVWFAEVFTKGSNAAPGKFVAVDRYGNELFQALWIYEGPDQLNDGTVRVTNDQGLIGYADSTGKVIVEPIYSWGHPFYNGTAKVTFSHRKVWIDAEHYLMESDHWLTIDKTGRVIE